MLDRTFTDAGSNDDLITKLEFAEAISGLSKDTAPNPDNVKYSDIKNLSENDKSGFPYCTKKASQKDRSLRISFTVISCQSPNQARTIPN